jgi:hypothetical protein
LELQLLAVVPLQMELQIRAVEQGALVEVPPETAVAV